MALSGVLVVLGVFVYRKRTNRGGTMTSLREEFNKDLNQPGVVWGMPDYIVWLEKKLLAARIPDKPEPITEQFLEDVQYKKIGKDLLVALINAHFSRKEVNDAD